ncbi:MAG: glycosyltransferase [Conexibacter sp.]
MTADEPRTIATRLAAALEQPLCRWPRERETVGRVVLLEEAALDAAEDERLATAAAVVVVGAQRPVSSAALRALAERVAARGLTVAHASFATVPAATDDAPVDAPLVVGAPPHDERVAQLLAAGPHALTLDPHVPVGAVGEEDLPARVCVVSFEVSGMTGGGIGTASTSLAATLARRGHDVTLLFTGWQDAGAGAENARWQAHYAERGVRLEILRAPGTSTVKSPHFPARSAYEIYCWLCAEEPFDVVHLPENMGHGAYAQLAKRQGLRFVDTTFVIGTHGPTRWAGEANRAALTREELLINDALERLSVAHADVLLGPSRYLHDYLRARGWTLPERVHVQPYATPAAVRERAREAHAEDAGAAAALPDEIVFFGRLETRKGVATLCDALDLLAAEGDLPPFEATFLGPVAPVFGEPADAYVARRAADWPWPWRIVSDRDQQGAADYLSRPGVLAVMPSLVDNAPNTVSEAVALGIPLVAGRTGGTGELVAAEQRDEHMFGDREEGPLRPLPLDALVLPADAQPLAELLRRRLTTPVAPARPPVDPVAVDDAYDRWHRAVRRARGARPAAPAPAAATTPSLAACVLFDGDEQLLAEQRAALAGDGIDVAVADVRAEGARAVAVAATGADLIAVIPPGDVPLPTFADTLHRAAASGADVYGCVALDGRAPDTAGVPDAAVNAFVPVPGPPLAGLTHPAFTSGVYAIRRTALERLGGFSPDARGDEADHELLNRAAAAGLAIEVVPEPLAVKRRPDRWTTFRAVWPHDLVEPPYDAEQWLRVERPFATQTGAPADLVGLLRGARTDARRFEGELQRQHVTYEQRIAEHRTWIDNLEAEAAVLRAEREAREQRIGPRAARALQSAARRAARRAGR